MPSFSSNSRRHLDTCHPDLQRLFDRVVSKVDCTIICGHRNQEDQNRAYREGFSKLWWPKSKHNSLPSLAVDVAPYHTDKPHIRWTDDREWYWFSGYVEGVASELGIEIRNGGN